MRTAVSARCAGACLFRRTYTREGQPPTEREEKGARLSTKRSQERHKTREHSKESPLVFYQSSPQCEENLKIISQKLIPFETKDLSLRLNKHNFPSFPPHCGVHIAQNGRTVVLTISAHALWHTEKSRHSTNGAEYSRFSYSQVVQYIEKFKRIGNI